MIFDAANSDTSSIDVDSAAAACLKLESANDTSDAVTDEADASVRCNPCHTAQTKQRTAINIETAVHLSIVLANERKAK